MSTGPEHYRQAEELLDGTRRMERGAPADASVLAEAQVHATLALAAATALGATDLPGRDWDAWRQAAAVPAPATPEFSWCEPCQAGGMSHPYTPRSDGTACSCGCHDAEKELEPGEYDPGPLPAEEYQ